MRHLFYCLIIFMSTNSVQGQTVTREMAIATVLQEIIVPPTLDHLVTAYIVKEPLQSGDTITPFLDGEDVVIDSPTWFVWINDDPLAFFEHKTRYVFIDATSGKYHVNVEKWWPELNGKSLFMSDAERQDLELILYSDIHQIQLKN